MNTALARFAVRAVLSASLVSAFAFPTVSSGTAFASHASLPGGVGCNNDYGVSCNGQYPGAQGCLSGSTWLQKATITDESTNTYIATVYLMYSSNCNAFWSRMQTSGYQILMGVSVSDTALSYSDQTGSGGASTYDGRMINYRGSVHDVACGSSNPGNGGWGNCTPAV